SEGDLFFAARSTRPNRSSRQGAMSRNLSRLSCYPRDQILPVEYGGNDRADLCHGWARVLGPGIFAISRLAAEQPDHFWRDDGGRRPNGDVAWRMDRRLSAETFRWSVFSNIRDRGNDRVSVCSCNCSRA